MSKVPAAVLADCHTSRLATGFPRRDAARRNVNNMPTLVRGVVAQGGTYGNAVSNQAGGARTNAIGFGNYAIGGGFGNQSSFYVDGVSSNAPANNLNSYVPSQDVVQEFRVVTNNVPAEYGNYAGGVVNLTTKAGSNQFHGTAYEYLRNKVLNANDYFSNRAGLPRPPLIQNQFGGTIGGPIRKDVMQELGLNTSYVQRDAVHETGTATVSIDASRQPTFTIKDSAAWDFLQWTAAWEELSLRVVGRNSTGRNSPHRAHSSAVDS